MPKYVQRIEAVSFVSAYLILLLVIYKGYSTGASLSSEAIYTTDKVICVGLCFVSTSGYQLY